MRVKAKINCLPLGNGFLLLAALAFAEFRGIVQDAQYNFLFTHDVAQVESARQMQVTFKKQVQAWKDILIRGSDPANLEKYSKEFSSLEKQVDESASALESSLADHELQQTVSSFANAHAQLGQKYRAGLIAFQASKGKDVAAVDALVKGQDRAPTDLIDGLVDSLKKKSAADQARLIDSAASTRRIIMVWAFIALVGSLLIARYLTGWITVGIQGALDRAEAIARGDLTGKEITVSSKDELGDLATAFNTMQDKLRNMITSVAENAQQVANASEEFSAVSQQITSN